jgi:hypothetical protein
MNLKEEVLKDLGIKFRRVRYFKQSPYQKARFKPEYVEQELWLYTDKSPYGYLVMESDFNNKEYWKEYRESILQ